MERIRICLDVRVLAPVNLVKMLAGRIVPSLLVICSDGGVKTVIEGRLGGCYVLSYKF